MPPDDTTAVNEVDHDDLKPSYARRREHSHRPLISWLKPPPLGREPFRGARSRCPHDGVELVFDGEKWVEA